MLHAVTALTAPVFIIFLSSTVLSSWIIKDGVRVCASGRAEQVSETLREEVGHFSTEDWCLER